MITKTVLSHEDNLLQKAFHAGEEMAKLGVDTAEIKAKIEEAVERGIKAARRAAKHGRHTAEGMLDDASYRIKHDPLRSVTVCFGVGMGLGAMVGWLATRNGRH